MKKSNRFTLFARVLAVLLTMGLALICGTAMGQDQAKDEEFVLEDVVVTSTYTETKLQETPISITAVSGEVLEERNINSVQDLGLIIPSSAIRQQGNLWGPNAYIGMRGVDQSDFIPAFEPGVVVYVDDIFNETVVGSTLDLIDLERVEALRGPQGTLFGKNAIGGAIRLISKTPQGDKTGFIQATYGDYHRLDFSGAYDFSLIEDKLFARISGSSKRIDGYMDRLDFTCQMNANGTPELAGDFPSYMRNYRMTEGDCKVGEKGGSQSDAAKVMVRYLATDKLEFNIGVDYTNIVQDTQAETILRGRNPDDTNVFASTDAWVNQWYLDNYGVSILGDHLVTGDPFSVYETFEDPIFGIRWPDKVTQHYTNVFARADYDITDNIHAKFIFGYREYQQVFATVNGTPFSFNAYLIDMNHDQTSYELRLNGSAFDERLNWTVGGYYYETYTHYLGHITLGTAGIASQLDPMWNFIFGNMPFGFDNNDKFYNDSESVFAHGVYAITDKLSLTAGARYTDESKTFAFDHVQLFQIEKPLEYGSGHTDWKLSLDYQFTDDFMAYVSAATGFRSEGANPRPWTRGQLLPTPDEEIIMYEIGAKTDWFDNRLRLNLAAYLGEYDPRVTFAWASQCTDPAGEDAGEPYYGFMAPCPAGTWAGDNAGGVGQFWAVYMSAPGTTKGVELDFMARPLQNLDLNASLNWFNYETDVGPNDLGYMDPDFDLQADWGGNVGVTYRIEFDDGSMLIPHIDAFYQGKRNNSDPGQKPNGPDHEIPDYTLFNARLTYVSADTHWSLSLEAQNLFDKFYWISITTNRNQDLTAPSYSRSGDPGWPRQIGLTLRYNFF